MLTYLYQISRNKNMQMFIKFHDVSLFPHVGRRHWHSPSCKCSLFVGWPDKSSKPSSEATCAHPMHTRFLTMAQLGLLFQQKISNSNNVSQGVQNEAIKNAGGIHYLPKTQKRQPKSSKIVPGWSRITTIPLCL